MEIVSSFELLKRKDLFLSNLSISKMTMEDLEEVLDIERASFPSPWPEEAFVQEMKNRFAEIFVARQKTGNRKLVGYICYWIFLDECHILNIATHPEFRRKKVASLLLDHALFRCRKRGVKRAFLEVRSQNIPAKSMYRKFGFVIDHIRKNYYKDTNEDAFVMELNL
jgi:ribosomal-protein-alanine N-acetyltransferase